MVLEFDHQKMEKIIEKFCNGQLATLDIYEKDGTYLINYTGTNIYTTEQQAAMKEVLDNNLPIRIKMQTTLTQFLENMVLDNVQKMEFHYSILDTNYIDMRMTLILKDPALVPSREVESDMARMTRLCKNLDALILDMGITDIPIPGIFRREGAGKNRKYTQQTIGDLTGMIASALEES